MNDSYYTNGTTEDSEIKRQQSSFTALDMSVENVVYVTYLYLTVLAGGIGNSLVGTAPVIFTSC